MSKNRVTQSESQDDVTASIPTDALQKQEVQEAKMIRSSPTLFHFGCVIDAIFTTNISDYDKI